MPQTLEHYEAITLVKEGFAVFPVHFAHKLPDGTILCTCGKDGCTGKHPQLAFSEKATGDRETIDKWYREGKEPQPGIAVHLGKSHSWVLDVDGEYGQQKLKELTDKYGDLPETRTVISGSGKGLHYYFANWVDKIPAGTLIPDAIHIKGDGNTYVVAPPSRHVSGERYRYLNRCAPVDAPEWLLKLVREATGNRTIKTQPGADMAVPARDYEIPITRILSQEQKARLRDEGNRIQGYSPVHSINNARAFSIDKDRNRWTCWECDSHGGLLELAAILSGICQCDEFTKPKDGSIGILPLSGNKFKQAVQVCLNAGIPAADLKRHLSGGKYHG